MCKRTIVYAAVDILLASSDIFAVRWLYTYM